MELNYVCKVYITAKRTVLKAQVKAIYVDFDYPHIQTHLSSCAC